MRRRPEALVGSHSTDKQNARRANPPNNDTRTSVCRRKTRVLALALVLLLFGEQKLGPATSLRLLGCEEGAARGQQVVAGHYGYGTYKPTVFLVNMLVPGTVARSRS